MITVWGVHNDALTSGLLEGAFISVVGGTNLATSDRSDHAPGR
jgi:hypothetical protein